MEPIGEWRADYRIAALTSAIVNLAISVWGQKGAKMTTPMDFMPTWGYKEGEESETPQQSVEEMKRILLSFTDHSTTED